MCGIGGVIFKKTPPSKESMSAVLRSMGHLVAHRGPDGEGHHQNVAIPGIGMVHRRLGIIDLELGGQPMTDETQRYTIVFNGEIYNFVELRERLIGLGHQFRTTSDTEVLLKSYIQWGEDCQNHLNGMWAFTIFDSVSNSLFASRDRFGVKPFYYVNDAQFFAFGSELKIFAALPHWDYHINEPVVARTLTDLNCLESTDKTLFSNVHRLPAGSCLTYRSGDLSVRKWWRTVDHLNHDETITEDRAIAKFREIFYDACRIRTRSDVPVATALSGGLDSSSIAGVLAQLRSETIERRAPEFHRAFIGTYPGTYQDERPYAEAVIQHTGALPYFIEVSAQTGAQNLDDIIWNCEDLYDLGIVGPWLVYREMRRQGVYVSLDGHGGDELLAGYHHHVLAETLASSENILRWPEALKLRSLLSSMYEGRKVPLESLGPLLAKGLLRRHNIEDRWLKDPNVLGRPPFLKIDPITIEDNDVTEELARLPQNDVLNKILYFDFHRRTLPPILRNFDRASMAHGIEVRSPFLDYRMVKFLFSLPSSLKLKNGQTKHLLRASLTKELPEVIRNRPGKIGFSSPADQWMKAGLGTYLLDTVNSQSFLKNPVWNGPLLQTQIEGYINTNNTQLLPSMWPFVQYTRFMEKLKSSKAQYQNSMSEKLNNLGVSL